VNKGPGDHFSRVDTRAEYWRRWKGVDFVVVKRFAEGRDSHRALRLIITQRCGLQKQGFDLTGGLQEEAAVEKARRLARLHRRGSTKLSGADQSGFTLGPTNKARRSIQQRGSGVCARARGAGFAELESVVVAGPSPIITPPFTFLLPESLSSKVTTHRLFRPNTLYRKDYAGGSIAIATIS